MILHRSFYLLFASIVRLFFGASGLHSLTTLVIDAWELARQNSAAAEEMISFSTI